MAVIEENIEGPVLPNEDPPLGSNMNDNKAVIFTEAEEPSETLSDQEARIVPTVESIVDSAYSLSSILRVMRKIPNLARSDDLIVADIVNSLFDSPPEEDKKRSCTPHPAHSLTDLGTQTIDESSSVVLGPINKGMTDKEQSELQKAIEESLLTSNNKKSSFTSYLAALPENPEEMERLNNFPCGIHNIGQSCWFSVVAQLLFSIKKYRQLLYDLVPVNFSPNPNNEILEVKVLLAMRLLFASMDKSNRKFLNPYPILEVINDISKKKDGRDVLNCQQDAMEMLLRVIDWIEGGVYHVQNKKNEVIISSHNRDAEEVMEIEVSSSPSPSCGSSKINMSVDDISKQDDDMDESLSITGKDAFRAPFVDVQAQQPCLSDDHPIKNIFLEKYSQRQLSEGGYNIVGKDCSVLHLLNIRYDNLHDAFEDGCFQGTVETWIESAPKVMIFSLNRFHYDKVGGSTKVHKPFRFPSEFYIDRYLSSNAKSVMHIRQNLAEMRLKLATVQSKIEGLEKFPLGTTSETSKLSNILGSTLGYLTCTSERKNDVGDCENATIVPKLPKQLPEPEGIPELDEAIKAIRKLHHNVLNMQHELNEKSVDLHNKINTIFDRPELQQHLYRLHAIVIHEGEANMGHYWIYVKGANGQWQKMNDKTVETASWAQIEKDAFGIELPKTSAYGLVYLAESADWMNEVEQELPFDLSELIEKENVELVSDIKRYKLNETRPHVLPNSPKIPMESDSGIMDPHSLYVSLTSNMNPLFTADERKRLSEKVEKLRFLLSKFYAPDFQFESAVIYSMDSLFNNTGLNVLNELIFLQKDSSLENAKAEIATFTHDRVLKLYDSYITEWFPHIDKYTNIDARSNILNFWRATGAGMHSKVQRYILVFSLVRSGISELVTIAERELKDFDNERLKQDYLLFAQFCMCLYDLVRVQWRYVLKSITFLANPDKPSLDCQNDFMYEWTKNLRDGISVYHVYNALLKELNTVVKVDQWRWDCEYVVTPLYTIKGLVLTPFLNIISFLVYVVVHRDIEDSELQNLIEPHATLIYKAIKIVQNLAASESSDVGAFNSPCLMVLKRLVEILEPLLHGEHIGYRLALISNLRQAVFKNMTEESTPSVSLCAGWTNIMEDIQMTMAICLEVDLNCEESAYKKYTDILNMAQMTVQRACFVN